MSYQLKFRHFACALAYVCSIQSGGVKADNPEQGEPDRIKVTGGIIEGVKHPDGIRVFKGIPFAAPPVGNLRWRAPQPVKPWEGVKQARAYGPSPEQGRRAVFVGIPDYFGEDCLFLNVWTPAKNANERLPVMVWFYGGGFKMGSTALPASDGALLAAKGVIVVSVNYRLGAFGFLAHPELTREGGGSSGNYGLLDQIAGLDWVRDNIAAFGGDPGCVTIFGESAGADAVSMLAASPKAKGLFQRLIAESGGTFGPPGTSSNEGGACTPTLKFAESEGQAFLARLGVKDIAAARALRADAILKENFDAWPVLDGSVLTGDQYKLYEAGEFNATPVLIGNDSDEGSGFAPKTMTTKGFDEFVRSFCGERADSILAVYPHATDTEATQSMKDIVGDAIFQWQTWAWARLQFNSGKGKAFVYRFDNGETPGHAGHGAEVPYVFRTLQKSPSKPSAQDLKLSETISSYWVNFAKTGNPNGPDLPEWRTFDPAAPKAMFFDPSPGMKPIPNIDRLQALDAFFAWKRGLEK